jgi:hypothetical protein
MMKMKDQVVEEAVELADRFPDMSDVDVFEALETILEISITPENRLGRLAIVAYDNGKEAAERSIWY